MKCVIYHCYGGNHSSVVAAALHVGLLPENRLPFFEEIMTCPYFDCFTKKNAGELHFMGKDGENNLVFTMGCLKAGLVVEKAVNEILRALNHKKHEVIMVNTLPIVNIPLKIGGFISRSLGMIFPGRWLAVKGILMSYNSIHLLVQKTKKQLSQEKKEILY